MTKMAIIDCGTNTFHLLIGSLNSGNLEISHNEKIMVQLGKGGISKNTISEEAMKRAISALEYYKEVIDSHQVDSIHAFATSAFRNANNGEQLVQKVFKELGIQISVISGDMEAELIYKGVRRALEIGESPALIVDIGGGSVEFILATSSESLWKQSFEIGAQRLLDKFHQKDPIPPEQLEALYDFLEASTSPLQEVMAKHKVETLIGSSGTFETLSAMYCAKHGLDEPEGTSLPLPKDEFISLFQSFIKSNREQRLQIPGMLPMRVDMIVVASSIINYLIKRYNLSWIRVSSYAMKEGIFFEQSNSN